MQLLLRFLFLFTIGFMYADCEQYSNEADCIASAECEWHADEMACEDAGSDDHDDHDHEEHCEDFLTEADCGMHSECEWHADEMACEDAGSDDHGHECEDCMSYCVNYVMTNYGYTEEEGSAWCLSTSTNAFGCAELCSDHDDHDHDDHDDHEVASNVIEMTGLSEGATTFTLSIIHDGHADYTSMPIYVEVHGEEDGEDHDDHDHEEEHCEDFLTEADCGMHSECEWHADEMACEDAGSDDHDDHDHEEEHCEDFLTEADCGMHSECEWHADEMACEDAGSDDHDDHDHEEEHCEDFLTEADCGMHSECEWHADEMACEDAGSDDHDDHDHDDHDDHDHGDCGDFDHLNVDGISLEHDGMVVYSQFQGYITGSLELHVNEPMDFTVHFLDANGDEIEFTEENPASCFPLGFEIDDPSIVSITIEENHDDHDDDDHDDHDHEAHCEDLGETECEASDHCEWHADEMACEDAGSDDHDDHDHDDHDDHEVASNVIEMTGLSEGATTFTLSIIHDGHADYTSMPIYVEVHGEEDGEDHDDHDHEEEHCEDFLTEADCGMHSECEWHADEMACEDAGSDDHDDHDHEEEHCEDFLTEADCGMHSECEWHADEMA